MSTPEQILRSVGISNRNIRDLELILLGTQMSVIEGLVEIGVSTGYLQEVHILALTDALIITQEDGTWVN